jgi:CRISPR-associated protein Csd1
MEQIGFVLVLDREGYVTDVQDMRDGDRAPRLPMPRPPKSTSNIEPRYLYGNSAYVLGVLTDAQNKKLPSAEMLARNLEAAKTKAEKVKQRCVDEHTAWLAYHREALEHSDDNGLNAVLRFIETWTPEQFKGLRYGDEIKNGTIALRLDGDTDISGNPRLISDRP